MNVLLSDDVWKQINRRSYPDVYKKNLKSYKRFTRGDSAVFSGYVGLVKTSPFLKFFDPHFEAARSGRKEMIDLVFSNKIDSSREQRCSDDTGVCIIKSYFKVASAKTCMYLWNNYCTCYRNDKKVISRLIDTIIRDKDLESAKPLDRFRQWLIDDPRTIDTIISSISYGSRDKDSNRSGLPLIEWLFDNFKSISESKDPLFTLHRLDNFCTYVVNYALSYNDGETMKWIEKNVDVSRIELRDLHNCDNIMGAESLCFLVKKLFGTHPPYRNDLDFESDFDKLFCVPDSCKDIFKNVVTSVLNVVIDVDLETLDKLYCINKRVLYHILMKKNCGNDRFYSFGNFPLFEKLLTCPKLKQWLKDKYPLTNYMHHRMIDVRLKPLSTSDRLSMEVVINLAVEKRSLSVIWYIVSRLLCYKTNITNEDTNILTLILNHLSQRPQNKLCIDDMNYDATCSKCIKQALVGLAICRSASHISANAERRRAKVSKKLETRKNYPRLSMHELWYDPILSDATTKIAKWFWDVYKFNIVDPISAAKMDNIVLLEQYFNRIQHDWDREFELECQNSLSGDEDDDNTTVSTKLSNENILVRLVSVAGPNTLVWMKYHKNDIMTTGTLKGDYSKHYPKQDGPQDFFELMLWNHRRENPHIERFFE